MYQKWAGPVCGDSEWCGVMVKVSPFTDTSWKTSKLAVVASLSRIFISEQLLILSLCFYPFLTHDVMP